MGFLNWILGPKPKEEPKLSDPILIFELYEKAPESKWKLMRTHPYAVNFEEIIDSQPGFTYRLTSRHASGRLHTLWYRHLEGLKETQETTTTSFADINMVLNQMIQFGKEIESLKEDIRDALGWAFPKQQQSINGSWQTPALTSKSKTSVEVMSQWRKPFEEAVKCANRISKAEYERNLANLRKNDITKLI